MLKNISRIFLLLIISSSLTACNLNWKEILHFDSGNKNNGPGLDTPLKQDKDFLNSLSEKTKEQSKIQKFNNKEEMVKFLKTNSNSGSSRYRSNEMWGGVDDVIEDSSVDSFSAPMTKMIASNGEMALGNSLGSDDFSETNNQVEGVDEADIIKTDGKYVFALIKNSLYIIDAYPADTAKVLSIIKFKSRPKDLFIKDDYLIVFGRDNNVYNIEPYSRFKRHSSFTFLKVFDVSDPINPKQKKDWNFEGNYFNSRLIGNDLYFITSNYQYYIDNEPIMPRILEGGEELARVNTDLYYFNIPYNRYNFTSVKSIDLSDLDKKIKEEVYLLPGEESMYVSENNIYLTYTTYLNEEEIVTEIAKELTMPLLSIENQNKINKISSSEDYILSKREKTSKIMIIIEAYFRGLPEEESNKLEKELEEKIKKRYQEIVDELEKTVIHRIAISNGKLKYTNYGEVSGRVLNQFSMDEYNGNFRIATTKSRNWSSYSKETESYSNVYVLGKDMGVIGSIKGLAKGERIYSARFMGDRAYVVTFKQIDPLFVIDLANPKKPKVLGKLKIPGFSNYLQPYSENLLIGLGKDAGENEWGGVSTNGIKLSLFDVADVKNPKEVDNYIIGDSGSDSIALRDHKAVLFSREKNLLVIPAVLREKSNERYGSKMSFSGALVFDVNERGFKLRAKVDHSNGGESAPEDYWGGYRYYDNTVKRSLYIDNALYTLSNNFLNINALSDLKEIKSLKLELKESGDDFDIIN